MADKLPVHPERLLIRNLSTRIAPVRWWRNTRGLILRTETRYQAGEEKKDHFVY